MKTNLYTFCDNRVVECDAALTKSCALLSFWEEHSIPYNHDIASAMVDKECKQQLAEEKKNKHTVWGLMQENAELKRQLNHKGNLDGLTAYTHSRNVESKEKEIVDLKRQVSGERMNTSIAREVNGIQTREIADLTREVTNLTHRNATLKHTITELITTVRKQDEKNVLLQKNYDKRKIQHSDLHSFAAKQNDEIIELKLREANLEKGNDSLIDKLRVSLETAETRIDYALRDMDDKDAVINDLRDKLMHANFVIAAYESDINNIFIKAAIHCDKHYDEAFISCPTSADKIAAVVKYLKKDLKG